MNSNNVPSIHPEFMDQSMLDSESPPHLQMEVPGVMSSPSDPENSLLDHSLTSPDESRRSSQQLEAKIEVVYSLLAMLGGQAYADVGETLLALSTNAESCLAMRQSGCLPLLVQLVQSEKDFETRKKASEALHNLVHSQSDEKIRKRESKILKLLEVLSAYIEVLETNGESSEEDDDKHPVVIVSQIMKSSFDEGHRQAICQLGGVYFIVKLIQNEHTAHGSVTESKNCNLLRRYACMILTNLTFGDSGNKALLCSHKDFIRALVNQLQSPSDELRQVTASVLRNLSWRADSTSKEILKECGSVEGLMKAAMMNNRENTLVSILSALWNLSAHCIENKNVICSVEGALQFLVQMLSYKSITDSQAVTENSGGILRNISSQIALRDDYRNIIRRHSCLEIFTDHLRSKNLTIVSNACGVLWNLSSHNHYDQEVLWKLGAPALLRSLGSSKHKMIAMGSSATLTILLNAKSSQISPILDDGEPLDLSLPCSKTRNQMLSDNSFQENFGQVEKSCSLTNHTELSPVFVKRSHEIKSSSFASLNVNEQTGSSQERRSQRLQSCGSSSLPYVNATKSGSLSCVPTRNKYSDFFEHELATSEEPFDFSRRYSETRASASVSKTKCPEKSPYKYDKADDADEKLSIYAETDLDQPTDYSLRYAEDDSDSDSDGNNVQKTPVEFVGDTIKTYCTEGTPYETPLNFSTSTSMSDLRPGDRNVADKNKALIKENGTDEITSDTIKGDGHTPEKHLELKEQPQSSKTKSDYSSGITSPEKPMNYCEEGTPGYFSRVSSFGSLNSSPACTGEEKIPKDLQKNETNKLTSKDDDIEQKIPTNEVKVVKFEENVNYCEETPLMFSRSSSLGSLGSMEQHSIHDDRSSVISDFSRLTSGIVSPSEIPDSPTQTIPPTPNPHKAAEMTLVHKKTDDSKPRVSARKVIPKSSFFEDDVKKFKEESTPTRNSITTSLSSLTIDDQDEGNTQKFNENRPKLEIIRGNLNIDYKKVMSSQDCTDGPVFDIRRYGGCERQLDASTSGATSSRLVHNVQSTHSKNTNGGITLQPEILPPPLPVDNTVHTYCTEDTPAVLSHNGSISDLSISTMSMLDEEPIVNKVYLSENSSQSSEGYQNKIGNEKNANYIQPKAQVTTWERMSTYRTSNICPISNDRETPPYLAAKDEVSHFVVEDSPMEFSLRSSLSNLTFESSRISGTTDASPRKPTSPEPGPSQDCTELCVVKDDEDNDARNSGTLNSNQSTEKLNEEENIELEPSTATEVESFDSLDEKFESSNSIIFTELDSSVLNETAIGECKCDQSATHDSLKKKKWKWKWRFNSETPERKVSRESSPCEEPPAVQNIGKDICSTSRMDTLYSRSLDASYRKKKWWKWKFGSKEAEYPQDLTKHDSDNVNSTSDNKVDEQNPEESVIQELKENPNVLRSEIVADNKNKSKRWKWRWKFNFRPSENGRPEDVLKFSKFKHSVSPIETRESYLIGSSTNQKIPEHATIHSLKQLSRSMSEPRRNKKYEESKVYTIPRVSLGASSDELKGHGSCYEGASREPLESYIRDVRDSLMSATGDQKNMNAVAICNSSSNNTGVHMTETVSGPSGNENGFKKSDCPDYAALVEECIQLGMPYKNKSTNDGISTSGSNELLLSGCSEETIDKKSSSRNCETAMTNTAILEECIQLGMPKKTGTLEKRSHNTKSVVQVSEGLTSGKAAITKGDESGHTAKIELPENTSIPKKTLSDQDKGVTTSNISGATILTGDSMKTVFESSPQSRVICKEDLHFLKEKFSVLGKSQGDDHSVPSEVSLDPVTLAIVKRILANRLNNESLSISEISKEVQTRTGTDNSDDCDFEIVLEERIKVSLPKNTSKPREGFLSPITYRTSSTLNPDSNIIDRPKCKGNFVEECNIAKSAENKDSVKVSENIIEGVLQKSSNINDLTNSSLIEECIQLGMPKKKHVPDEIIYANVSASPGYSRSNSVKRQAAKLPDEIGRVTKEVDRSREQHIEFARVRPTCTENSTIHKPVDEKNSSKLSEKQNYAALLEECIQMGMPKRKENPRETNSLERRPNSQSSCAKVFSGMSSPVNSNSLPRVDKHDIGKLSVKSTQLDDAEEVIYANVAMTAGYSRSSTLDRPKTNFIKCVSPMRSCQSEKKPESNETIDDDKEQSYSALVEECIQMGMPVKKKTEQPAVKDNNGSNDKPNNIFKKQNYEALIEECIQLGMPKKVMTSQEAIYANTTERYSTFKGYTKSDSGFNSSSMRKIGPGRSEPGSSSSIPFANFGHKTSESNFSASSMEDGLESNFPKTRHTITVSRTVGSSTVSESSRVVPSNAPKESESKNVNVASVARNTPESHRGYFRAPVTVTGAEDDSKTQDETIMIEQSTEKKVGGVRRKNGFSMENIDVLHSVETHYERTELDNTSEMSFARFGEIDSSLLDPKIILESLDRYTKKLVSEAEMRLYRNSEYKAFLTEQTKYQKSH